MGNNQIKEIMEALAKEMPFQWRVQSFSKNKAFAQCIAYIDARDVAQRLDDVMPGQWQDKYEYLNNNLYSSITIKLDGEWVSRSDVGSKSDIETEKGEASDAFKRAAVKWGIGRFLYGMKVLTVPTNGAKNDSNKYPYVVDEKKERVWDITEYCNRLYKSKTGQRVSNALPPQPKVIPTKVQDNTKKVEKVLEVPKTPKETLIDLVNKTQSQTVLKNIWETNAKFQKDKEFVDAVNKRKAEILSEGGAK